MFWLLTFLKFFQHIYIGVTQDWSHKLMLLFLFSRKPNCSFNIFDCTYFFPNVTNPFQSYKRTPRFLLASRPFESKPTKPCSFRHISTKR